MPGPDSGKNLVKKIKSSKEKRDKASELSNKNTTSVDSTDFKDSSMNNKSPKSVAISENKINKKSKMKRLVFKKEFKGVGNALNLIPETYKVNGKQFHMTDGNEKYEIRWEGSLTEGRAIVLKASDKNLMNEDMENMKRLMGYKSQDTLGTVKGADRIDENKKFNDIWGKTKNLMTEMTGGYGFTGEGNLEGMNEYSIDEELSLNEGLMDKIKDKLTQPLTKFIEKLGDKGEELYNNLVQKFGENPSPKDIAGQIKSELKESLYEDRFGDMQVGSNPKYADSEGKQNKTDKAMSILNQVAGINMISIGFPVAILAMILGLPAFGAGWLVYALGWIISFIIMGLTTKYGRKRANQTDEGMDEEFPDLTGDGKVTQADILMGRGVELDENIGDEEMDFLRTVKSTQPDLYNKYINLVKRKGLEFAVNDFHQYTDQGKADEKQRQRDLTKQERLNNEISEIDEILSMVSQDEMGEFMAEFRSDLLKGVKRDYSRFGRNEKTSSISLLASAYVKANNLDQSMLKFQSPFDEDELSVFDDISEFILNNNRIYKIFQNKFDNKFRAIINAFL